MRRLFARKRRQLAVDEVAEALARGVDILAVAEDEVHRHVERIVAVALVTEALVEHEGKHSGPRRVGVFPDMASEALVAVGLAFRERRVGEQGRRDRLQGEADTELLYHVGFGTIVQINLNGTGAEHHVEPEIADPRHVAKHDRVSALGHDRQVGPRLVGPHAKAEEAQAKPVADRLHLFKVTSAFRAAFVKIAERRARQLQLSGRFKADRPVRAGQRDDLSAFLDRLPTELGQAEKQVANAAGLVPAWGAMIVEPIDELLMLGPDPPRLARLFPALENGKQIIAALDRRARRQVGSGRHRRSV